MRGDREREERERKRGGTSADDQSLANAGAVRTAIRPYSAYHPQRVGARVRLWGSRGRACWGVGQGGAVRRVKDGTAVEAGNRAGVGDVGQHVSMGSDRDGHCVDRAEGSMSVGAWACGCIAWEGVCGEDVAEVVGIAL